MASTWARGRVARSAGNCHPACPGNASPARTGCTKAATAAVRIARQVDRERMADCSRTRGAPSMRTIWGKEEAMAGTIDLTVNGRRESVAADPQAPLLTVLRN